MTEIIRYERDSQTLNIYINRRRLILIIFTVEPCIQSPTNALFIKLGKV
jgi:hypothetical protein